MIRGRIWGDGERRSKTFPRGRDDASRPSLRGALVDLVVSRLRDIQQALAVGGATHHVSEPVLDPIHGGEAIGCAVTHGSLRRIGACIVDRKALAGGAFI